jgi:hypothetical protein
MEKEQERKQIKVVDMQDRLAVIRHKVAFLRDGVMPTGGKEDYHALLTFDSAEGLTAILGEIADELKEIGDAEIIAHPATDPLPLRREA